MMANSTDDESPTFSNHELSCASGLTLTHKIITLTLGVPLSVSAVLGNVLIIVALHKTRSLHPPSKLLLGCLAFTDLGVGLVALPLFCVLSFPPEPPSGCSGFQIVLNTTSFSFSSVSLLTMTAISVDRLLALLLGLRYRQVVTVRRVKIFVVALWLMCSSVVMVAFYNRRIALVICSAGFLLCTVTSTLCYTKIYRTLRLSQAQVQDQDYQGQQNGKGIQLNKTRYKKTVSTALWIQMTLLACYVPFALASVLVAVVSRAPSIILAWLLSVTVMYFNSTLNPLIYCWKMRELRQEVKNMVQQFCCPSS